MSPAAKLGLSSAAWIVLKGASSVPAFASDAFGSSFATHHVLAAEATETEKTKAHIIQTNRNSLAPEKSTFMDFIVFSSLNDGGLATTCRKYSIFPRVPSTQLFPAYWIWVAR